MIDENDVVIGYLEKGMAVYINAYELQAGNVPEDTTLIYVINRLQQNGQDSI